MKNIKGFKGFDKNFTATTGDSAHSATTGNYAQSSVEGKNSIACAVGCKGQVKGVLGSWLVLGEYDNDCNVIDVQSKKIDGIE